MLTVRPTSGQLTALNNLNRSQARLGVTTERLSTGLRINRGSDDPAGLIGAENLRGDLVENGARRRTIGAERQRLGVEQSGRRLAADVLREVRGLTIEAASDTTSPGQREAIQSQIDSSLDALRRIEQTTGAPVSGGLEALAAGGEANAVDGDPAAAAALLDERIGALAAASAEAGAYERYTLDVDERLAEDREVVLTRSLSQIADADFAQESSNLARDQILAVVGFKMVGLLDATRGEALLTLLSK